MQNMSERMDKVWRNFMLTRVNFVPHPPKKEKKKAK